MASNTNKKDETKKAASLEPSVKKHTNVKTKKTTASKNSSTTAAKSTKVKKETAKSTKKSTTSASAKKTVKKVTTTKDAKNAEKKPINKKSSVQKSNDTAPIKLATPKEEKVVLEEIEKDDLAILNTKEIKVVKKKSEYDDEQFANTILGLELPVGDHEDRKVRLGNYARDALIFAIIIPILDLFAMLFIESYKAYPITNSDPINYCLTLLIDFITIFILTYIIDFVHGENSVKRMKK